MRSTRFRVRAELAIAWLVTLTLSAHLIPTFAAPLPLAAGDAFPNITSVSAEISDRGVLIKWHTDFELGNLGFDLFRERNGRREKLNRGIIAGSTLIVGPNTALNGGFAYSWLDPTGSLDSKYYLVSTNLTGKVKAYAPVMPANGSRPAAASTTQLSNPLDVAAIDSLSQTEWPEDTPGKSESVAHAEKVVSTLTDQLTIAATPSVKIGVRHDGWYRVTQAELAAVGFDTSLDALNLRLFCNGTEVAILVSRRSGPLTANDYLEFWGEGVDLPSTDTQIYWLTNGDQPGKRIPIVGEIKSDGSPVPIPTATPPAPDSFGMFGLPGRAIPMGGESERAERVERKNAASGQAILPDDSGDASRIPGLSEPSQPTNFPSSKVPSQSTPVKAALRAEELATNKNAVTLGSETPRRSSLAVRRKAKRRQRKYSALNSHLKGRQSRRLRDHYFFSFANPVPAFVDNVERKDRTVYFAAALNGPAENFFGEVLVNDPPPLSITLQHIEFSSALVANLRVSVRGITVQDHQLNVFLNGTSIGKMFFSGQNAAVRDFSFPLAMLAEGDNAVKLVPTAAGNDISIVDYLIVTYSHAFVADNDSLQFTLKATQTQRIEGFSNPNIRFLDITDVRAIQEIKPIVEASGSGFAATVPAGGRGKARRVVAVSPTPSIPASIVLNQPSTLSSPTNAADLLIISYKDFIPALAPLVSQRRDRDGYLVKVVDIEDVYDEFSFGIPTANAIKDFLSFAHSSWSRAPRYLLLVGDASYDPRNYLGSGSKDFVPSLHVDTFFMETDSDDSLADFDNDGIPELAVGRLPARTLAEANVMVSKIVNFSPANVPQTALMVADNPVGYDFQAFDEHLISLLPASMSVQRVYRSSDPTPHADIVTTLNQGVALVNYSGHGNVDIWAGPIFSTSDAIALTNGNRLPFVTVMDCLNGYFSDPLLEGMAESLLKAPQGGAIGGFASSGETTAIPQHEMGERLLQLIYGNTPIALGDASRQAKTATQDLDVRRTWILFGDPTMKIR